MQWASETRHENVNQNYDAWHVRYPCIPAVVSAHGQFLVSQLFNSVENSTADSRIFFFMTIFLNKLRYEQLYNFGPRERMNPRWLYFSLIFICILSLTVSWWLEGRVSIRITSWFFRSFTYRTIRERKKQRALKSDGNHTKSLRTKWHGIGNNRSNGIWHGIFLVMSF